METNQAPLDAGQPAEDHLLEDLAALTGMFNPEIIWQEKEQLDDQEEEQEKAQGQAPEE